MKSDASRRGFRFSLGGLLLLVTVLCVYLGWQSLIVRQRQAALKELGGGHGFHFILAKDWSLPPIPGTVAPEQRMSPVRRLLGDEPVRMIYYTSFIEGFSEAELARVRALFPEAETWESQPEPCHPGCFPAGTLVETPTGARPIESIAVGDELVIVLASGGTATAAVESIFITENWLWEITTDGGLLVTTEQQPLVPCAGCTRAAGQLEPEAEILRRTAGGVAPLKVRSVRNTRRIARVYNLVLGDSQIFVAGGFLARSKPPADASASPVVHAPLSGQITPNRAAGRGGAEGRAGLRTPNNLHFTHRIATVGGFIPPHYVPRRLIDATTTPHPRDAHRLAGGRRT